MSIPELEALLQKAQERQTKALQALRSKYQNNPEVEFAAAHESVLEAERALAAAKGEPHAVAIDFPVSWCTGAPLPHLLQSDNQTFLVFFLRVVDPEWDGTWIKIRHRESPEAEKIAVVEFEDCFSAKMGSPNDEVFDGHPLYGKGFEGYRALAVRNSLWIKELQDINRIHRGYDSSRWRELQHYIFPFHDSTFECVAQSFKVETFCTSLTEVLAEICRRLVHE